MRTALVTGAAGFIGFHLSNALLNAGWRVIGYDGFTDYYDVRLKKHRVEKLRQHQHFDLVTALLEDQEKLVGTAMATQPEIIVHLAAQAGVRYSSQDPQAYINSNLVGTYNVLESARATNVGHLLLASTSSVYGANAKMPFKETDNTDHPLSLYAATKKSNEVIAHSYAHLYKTPTTMFRFFTVYGPWGRPDMALFKFTKRILEGKKIDVYNNGDMWRDFTYISDLIKCISGLIDTPPNIYSNESEYENDSLSSSAPFRTVNIGNSQKIRLLDFISAIEESTGLKAACNFLPMQPGDVPITWADSGLLHELIGSVPRTDFRAGVEEFVKWYREYYFPPELTDQS